MSDPIVPTRTGTWWRFDAEAEAPEAVAVWHAFRDDERLAWRYVPDDGEPETYHVEADGLWLREARPDDVPASVLAEVHATFAEYLGPDFDRPDEHPAWLVRRLCRAFSRPYSLLTGKAPYDVASHDDLDLYDAAKAVVEERDALRRELEAERAKVRTIVYMLWQAWRVAGMLAPNACPWKESVYRRDVLALVGPDVLREVEGE